MNHNVRRAKGARRSRQSTWWRPTHGAPGAGQPAMAKVQRMTRRKLGEILVQSGVIDDLQLQAALEEQRRTQELLGEVLVRRGFATETQIVQIIAEQFSVPYLGAVQIELNPRTAHLLPPEFMRQHLVVPLDRFGNCLTVLIAGMLNADVLAQIEQQAGCTVRLFIGTVSDVRELITQVEALGARAEGDSDEPAPAKTAASPKQVSMTARRPNADQSGQAP